MISARAYPYLLLPLLFVGAGCDSSLGSANTAPLKNNSTDATAQKVSKPVAPFKLAVPPELPGAVNGYILRSMEPDLLIATAKFAAEKGKYELAAIAQYWYVRKTQKGQYAMACYLAITKQIEPAFYWLQKAAIEEGVDAKHAERDEDLETLREDVRWNQVLSYIQECNNYFEKADSFKTILLLPRGYTKSVAIPAVIWMHGLDSSPSDLLTEAFQKYADQLNVALIGISGTKPRGPNTFAWAEDIDKDSDRIREALAVASDQVTIEKGKIITLGFSQGGQVGLELAARYPEEFAGSIVLSPRAASQLQSIQVSPLLASRRFVISCGALENRENLSLVKKDNEWLVNAKAEVLYKLYPRVSTHALPADFLERFPEWVIFILNRKRSREFKA